MPMPSHSPRVGRCPNARPNRPIHSGIEAIAIAASPDDTSFSASTTMPLPSSIISRPMTARVGHCARVGDGTPRRRSTAYSRAPATSMRPPDTPSSAGQPPSSAKRMPR